MDALLLDQDRGRKTADILDIRFFHLAEELPGVKVKAIQGIAFPLPAYIV